MYANDNMRSIIGVYEHLTRICIGEVIQMKKRYVFIFIAAILLIVCLYACNGSIKYKHNITKTVKSNIDYLNGFVNQQDLSISNQLIDMGVKDVQVKNEFIVFVVDSTGLSDGGVEYGFYYSTNSEKLNKSLTPNDYMVIEEITDNWYYYEWHNG